METQDAERGRAERGQVAATAAEVYEEFFVPALFGQWTDPMLDAAGVGPGDRVVDVGCGTGVLARAAAARVGARRDRDGGDPGGGDPGGGDPGGDDPGGDAGDVVGVDLNPGMLAVARRSPAAVSWREGAAEALPLGDDAVDRALSQFMLMFAEDPGAAVAEMARVTRPGGTVALATWASVDETPGYAAMVDLLRTTIGEGAARALLAPYAMGSAGDLRRLLAPGLEDVAVARHDGTARFPSIDAWVHTDIRGWTLADDVDDATFDRLLARARDALVGFTDGSGRVRFPAPALIAVGRVPDGRSG